MGHVRGRARGLLHHVLQRQPKAALTGVAGARGVGSPSRGGGVADVARSNARAAIEVNSSRNAVVLRLMTGPSPYPATAARDESMLVVRGGGGAVVGGVGGYPHPHPVATKRSFRRLQVHVQRRDPPPPLLPLEPRALLSQLLLQCSDAAARLAYQV